jgi:hypothetical protein
MCPKLKENVEPNARNANGKYVVLEVRDLEMKEGNNLKYVGYIISSSNEANISRRKGIGILAISTLFAILNEVSFGYQCKGLAQGIHVPNRKTRRG